VCLPVSAEGAASWTKADHDQPGWEKPPAMSVPGRVWCCPSCRCRLWQPEATHIAAEITQEAAQRAVTALAGGVENHWGFLTRAQLPMGLRADRPSHQRVAAACYQDSFRTGNGPSPPGLCFQAAAIPTLAARRLCWPPGGPARCCKPMIEKSKYY
jgi:hypothetical protein